MHRLITIKFSHYNEKARWGLDRFGVPYSERAYLPLLHMPAVAVAVRKNGSATADKVSTRLSTPVLQTDDGRTLCDSSEILRYLDERYRGTARSLYADAETFELERDFHDRLGAHSRRWAYFFVLDDAAAMHALARANVGALQSTLFRLLLPVGRRWMKRAMAIDRKRAQRSREHILQTFDEVTRRLADGRPYLCGDHFSAADLSFACMAAPALVVARSEGFGAELPALTDLPEEASRLARELRATPAGAHALDMFATERHGRRRPVE